MTEKLTEIIDYLKKMQVAFLFALAIVISIILFIDEKYAKLLYVLEFRNLFSIFLGPILLVIVFFLVARGVIYCQEKIASKKELKKLHQILHHLTPDEKGYLQEFMTPENTLIVSIDDGVMGGLVAKKIVYRSSNMSTYAPDFPFNLQVWVRSHLEENPKLLEGHREMPKRNSPNW